VAENAPVGLNRTERTLTFIIAGIIGLSVIAIAAILIAKAAGAVLTGMFWASVLVLPLIGLPIAMVLGVVLVLLFIRRRSLAQDARR
jgi:hypothetical protein